MSPSDERIEFRLPGDLKRFLKEYSDKNNTTITNVLVDFIRQLKKDVEEADVPQI